jgi:hypothetical protein
VDTPIKSFTFDPSVHYAFTEGDCWILARSICEDASYELVTISSDDNYWYHVGARQPDGTVLDIDGVWSERNWLNHWGGKLEEQGFILPLFIEEWDIAVFDSKVAAINLRPVFYASELVGSYRNHILELIC